MDISFPIFGLSLLLFGISFSDAQELVITPAKDVLVKKVNGGGFSLSCKAEGLAGGEDPGLQWLDPANDQIGGYQPSGKRKRIYLINLGTDKLVQFDKVTQTDEGAYECKGTINGKTVSKVIKLSLVKGIEMTSPLSQHPVIFTDALIECNATASPSPDIKWLYGNNRTTITMGKETRYRQDSKGLIIKNITKEYNGIYVCMVMTMTSSDENSESKSFEINVTVTVPPKMKGPPSFSTPTVGKPFKMSCEADGTPRPTFKFLKEKVVLTGDRYEISVDNEQFTTRGNLVIEKLEDSDEGEYTCQAENNGGKQEETVFIDTLVPPTIDDIQEKSAAEGKTVDLVCVVHSDPAATVTWQIKGSDVVIGNDPVRGISVATESTDQGLIHIVTSKLTFSKLKPSDTNNYTCTALNNAGNASKHGSLIVEFKPNFANTPYSSTYGWVNHDTEIKCIADAAPLPSISWTRNGNPVLEGGNFKITQERGVRQLTSILKVSVNIENEKTIFGVYTCEAVNLLWSKPSLHNITLLKANKPDRPTVSIDAVTPTTIKLIITPPSNDGGQTVLDYKIVFYQEGKEDEQVIKKADISADPNEPRINYELKNLLAKITYLITVEARNAVGYGKAAQLTETTLAVRVPGMPEITSPKNADHANIYLLAWRKPLTGGAEITGYKIKYSQVEVDKDGKVLQLIGKMQNIHIQDGSVTSQKLEGLLPDTNYQALLSAINSVGDSDERTFMFKTAKGGMPVSKDQPQMATGAIIGILIAVIIILFIVIDVTFYFTKQCGLLWTIKGKVAGGESSGERADAEAADHEKEAFIKEGKQDSEEPSAKENVDMVDETEKGEEDLKSKELEPEDKEEKLATEPSTEPVTESAEEAKEAAGSPQTESAPDPATEPTPEAVVPDQQEGEKDPKA